jgi:hypothetical protein
MSKSFSNEILEIPPYHYAGTWLIGATTHAVDRFIADVERIFLPEQDHVGGTINFSLSGSPVQIGPTDPGSRKLRMKYRIRSPRSIDLGDKIFFDVRANSYFNWSHQVNFFLSLALAARSRVEAPITIILPGRMPRAAFDLYRQFGFEVVSTDGAINGRNFGWSVSHIEVVPSGRRQLIGGFMSRHQDDAAVFPSFDLPAKVFLSRRGTRSLTNEAEIDDVLSARGFSKVYAEDLGVPEQFALLRQADEVVAIHGAGLAPLQYRSLSRRPIRLIELAPAGIVTRWFGIMCEQVGGKYIAVRGRLKPEYVEGLYASEPFEKYCDDNFHVDPKSLEVAFDMIGTD